jgi:hypothetical protein
MLNWRWQFDILTKSCGAPQSSSAISIGCPSLLVQFYHIAFPCRVRAGHCSAETAGRAKRLAHHTDVNRTDDQRRRSRRLPRRRGSRGPSVAEGGIHFEGDRDEGSSSHPTIEHRVEALKMRMGARNLNHISMSLAL